MDVVESPAILDLDAEINGKCIKKSNFLQILCLLKTEFLLLAGYCINDFQLFQKCSKPKYQKIIF